MNVQPVGQPAFQVGKLGCQLPVLRQRFAHFYKCPDHEYTHLRGARTIENVGCHDGAVVGEDQWAFPTTTAPVF